MTRPHELPARRPSQVHHGAHTMAGDLHTSEPTKKEAREVSSLSPDPTIKHIAERIFVRPMQS